jgi:phosphoribosylamine---glycine ligase
MDIGPSYSCAPGFKPAGAVSRVGAVRVLLVGSGGREHALAWKLSQNPGLELHAAPGNPGIARYGSCHPVRADDAEGLLGLAGDGGLDVDLVVIGPEAPLVAGVGDALRRSGIAVFGPGRAAAQLEGSKTFAKEVMRAAGVATAATMAVARPPCVIKVDGLAAGKGVFVCRTQDELDDGLRQAAAYDGPLVIEELLEGEEVSLFALASGTDAFALAPAQDFKRLEDGDEGPNTGGMGSYSPVPGLDEHAVAELLDTVHRPVLEELARRGTPFVGLLYAGLMLTDDGPRVLEFNCRFGDPETQSILPRLDGDLLAALWAAATGELQDVELASSASAAVTVVLAAEGYPAQPATGAPIEGVDDAEAAGALVFHAGTALRDGRLLANGGRILDVTGRGATLAEARVAAYDAADHIAFVGMRMRQDIALAAAAGQRVVG